MSGGKGDPKWFPAIWRGKALSKAVHLLAYEGVIFVSRSIRRVRDNLQLDMLGNIEVGPWDHGMASLGHRLFQSRKYAGPDPIPALNFEELGALVNRQDVRLKTMQDTASLERDAVDMETSSTPSKPAKVEPSDQVMAVRDQHEDEELGFSFQDDEVAMLEIYDNSIEDDYDLHSDTCDNFEIDKLVLAFTPHEPNLTEHGLKELDDIAEIQRLCDMKVFIPFGENVLCWTFTST